MTWQIFEDDKTLQFKRWYDPCKLWVEIKQDKGSVDNGFEGEITDGETILAAVTGPSFYGVFDHLLAKVNER